MTADRELVDGISEEEFVRFSREELVLGFSREELGIHSDVEVEIYNVMKFLHKLSTKNGQEP